MNELTTPQPIVVGIDGSKAAIRAALWAVDEAVSRDAPCVSSTQLSQATHRNVTRVPQRGRFATQSRQSRRWASW